MENLKICANKQHFLPIKHYFLLEKNRYRVMNDGFFFQNGLLGAKKTIGLFYSKKIFLWSIP